MVAVLGSGWQDVDDEPNRRPVEIPRLCTTVGDTGSKATIECLNWIEEVRRTLFAAWRMRRSMARATVRLLRRLQEVCLRFTLRARSSELAALIAHGKFSSAPVLKVTSPGIPRSRRQLAGL
jgi:hypothetical protein